MDISDDEFSRLIAEAMDELPKEHMRAVRNVAIVMADEPSPEQREELKLREGQILFGLYEGVPLAKRGGVTNYPPDKITLFKHSMLAFATTPQQLKAEIKHTIWHELAHYFGLDHPAISRLEQKHP